MTPLDRMMSGVEIHAQAFETILGRDFLVPASLTLVVVVCLMLVTISGAAFSALTGWSAYASAAVILAGAHVCPYVSVPERHNPPLPGDPVRSVALDGGRRSLAVFRHSTPAP